MSTKTVVSNTNVVPNLKTYRHYLAIWIGQLLSILGSLTVQFTMIWWITTETQSSVYLSIGAFLGYLPQIVLSPFMGVVADKFDRRKIMMLSDMLQALATALLIIVFITRSMNLIFYFSILFLRSIFQTIQTPAKQAIVAKMVPKDKLSRLNGIDYLCSSLIGLLGPGFAALLLKFFTFSQILFVDIITFGFALIPLLIFRIPPLEDQSSTKTKSDLKEYFTQIRGGLQVLSSNRPFLVLLLTATVINFFLMQFNTLTPYFISVTNEGTEDHLAIVMAALQGGVMLGSLITSIKKQWNKKVRVIYLFMSLQYIGYFILSISPLQNYIMMSAGLIIAGLTFPIINTLFMTVVQQKIPGEYQGRIFSLMMAVSGLISPLGMIIAGPLANLLGIRTLWVISAISAFVIIQLIWKFTSISKAMEMEFHNQTSIGSNNKTEKSTELTEIIEIAA